MGLSVEKIKRDIQKRIDSQEISEAFREKFYDEYAHDMVADICDKMHQLSSAIATELLDIIAQAIESEHKLQGSVS